MGRRAINALKTLRRGGAKYVVLRPISIATNYNPSTGSAQSDGADGAADVTRVALLLDMLTSRPISGFGHMDGLRTDIEGVRKWAFMDGIGLVPTIRDKVIASTITYEVINVQTISDGDGPIVHVLALTY